MKFKSVKETSKHKKFLKVRGGLSVQTVRYLQVVGRIWEPAGF